jgi:hypothetical protein
VSEAFDALLREVAAAPPIVAAPTEAELPADLGRYRLLEVLGRGASGVVYLAVDRKLDRRVALKLLRLLGEHGPDALVHEARHAARIEHPNVAIVYEVGEANGLPFIAMELADGDSLEARIKRARPSRREALAIARTLATALGAAHRSGVVHRDLKPSNVRFTKDGRLKIVDFGLAAEAGASERAGTPAYMAPEQLAGRGADARSDVYALGIVLHELLSGARPLPGGLDPRLSAEDRRVIERLTAADPDARPRDGDDSLRVLAALEPRRAKQLALAGSVLALGAALTIALAASSTGALAGKRPPAHDPLALSRLTSFDERAIDDLALSPGGDRVAVVEEGELSLFALDGSRERVQLPREVACARWAGDELVVTFADEGGVVRTNLASGQSTPIAIDAARCAVPASDGRLAYVDAADRLVVHALGSEPRVLVEDFDDGVHYAWSADGRWLAWDTLLESAEQFAIDAIEIASGRRERLASGPPLMLSTGYAAFEWIDGDTIVYATSPAAWRSEPARLWSRTIGAEPAPLADLGEATVWQISIRSGRIAVARDETETDVLALDLETREAEALLTDRASQWPLVWLESGAILASNEVGSQGLVAIAADGSRSRTLSGGARWSAAAAAPIDTSWIAAVERSDERASLVTIETASGERVLLAVIETPRVRSFRDLRNVQVRCAARARSCLVVEALSDGRREMVPLRVRDLAFDGERPIGFGSVDFVVPGQRQARTTALSADGAFLFAGEGDRIDRIDARTGERAGEIFLPEQCGVQHLAAAPSGDAIYATAGCLRGEAYTVFASSGGATERIYGRSSGWITHPTPSPDGRTLLLAVTKFSANVFWAELTSPGRGAR